MPLHMPSPHADPFPYLIVGKLLKGRLYIVNIVVVFSSVKYEELRNTKEFPL